MAEDYTVKQGDYLARIAEKYGFTNYRTIWDHARNANLKKERGNPNVLYPGDTVYIPDKEEKQELGSTGQRHRFEIRKQKLLLRLAIKDFDHQPLSNATCQLHINDQVHDLTTDGNGRIEQTIPQNAETAVLVFNDPLVPFEVAISIKIGHLDPVEQVSGQKARLNNLGYNAGTVEDSQDQRFEFAVQEFQCDHDLEVDGICGVQTQAKLKEIHGC